MPSVSVLEQKKQVVTELSNKIKQAKGIVLADYRGLTVEQDTEMRTAFRKAGIFYKVYKNTLMKIAARENGLDGLDAFLEGPTAIAYSVSDELIAAKTLKQYASKYEKFSIKAGVVDGKVIDENGVSQLAEIPSREILIAKMLGSMNAPITGFVNVLNGNLRGLVVALNAIAEKKKE